MKNLIKTRRLEIRPFSGGSAGELAELLTDEEIKKTFMVPDFPSREALNGLVDRFFALSLAEDRFVRGMYLEDRLIGFVNDVDMENGRIELGYVVHPDHWGRGYATEMLQAVIPVLLAEGFAAVRTGAFSENSASIRVMEKCGMHRCAGTDTVEYRGRPHTCVYYEARKRE